MPHKHPLLYTLPHLPTDLIGYVYFVGIVVVVGTLFTLSFQRGAWSFQDRGLIVSGGVN